MKNPTPACLFALVCLLLCGCVYSDVRVPMSGDFHTTRVARKSGEATIHSVAWLVAWGDGGLQQAANNGGLTTIEYADQAFLNILFGLYMKNTTVVYGN